ncbi:hypothetical protein PP182_10290 [Maribacter sp. PR1]|uniref:Competence protein n=1 Tax=Maribacter cobaltidurans TaxID=1178778 RepID=A0ABU7IU24_9FLAO|nr:MULTISPECIES: hypothetical protein [Maribacter]MDC6389070.1 hypothetical protein [Maribacter sp. PR1]MEE1976457.1 hypothetical protein [Maribacter cobaltidurans]
MAFEEFKEDLMGAEADMRSYVETSDEYLRLRIFKVLMLFVTSIAQSLLIGIGSVFALLFLSFAACLAISESLDSYYSGFILVGIFYVLVGILFYVFRKKLNAPILKKFSKYYFEQS